jgi:hypothetical protein
MILEKGLAIIQSGGCIRQLFLRWFYMVSQFLKAQKGVNKKMLGF